VEKTLLKERFLKGRTEGRAEGRAEGQLEEKILIAKNLAANGFSIELIAKATGLEVEQLNKILA
jgi:predicted transposase/invertase (TIGR01784 family)